MPYPPKGRADHLVLGDWNAECSMCGAKRKASALVRNWQGQWRCPEHNEPRHPQDFVRAVADVTAVPWAQDPPDIYIIPCTPQGCSDMPGLAMPGCSVPGRAYNTNFNLSS
jgi:hypothetical protein